MYDYIKDPAEIYRESFARIRREVDLARLPPELHGVALRLVHAVGDPAILVDLVWSLDAVARAGAALEAGASILADARMVADGIIKTRLPAANPVICTLNEAQVPELARRLGTTRSAAAVELWRPHLAGSIVAIGNAPTALFHLLEMIEAGAPAPEVILGFSVGFVGAAESKAALVALGKSGQGRGIGYIALNGRRGGSALAAAAVNALASSQE
ncbi:MAG TPA: precorrin-8X methylmutase [Stellaceae bacterium]|nr:precorrin-8X methylmutase [Stellaceae bacterium]